MSLLTATRKALGPGARQADRLEAFIAGYCDEPLSASAAADPELCRDWEHGKTAHQKELEVRRDRH